MTGAELIYTLLVGISLCADCFAVTLCSSLAVGPAEARKQVSRVAAVFAVIQSSFLLAGWVVAYFFSGLLAPRFQGFTTVAGWVGFLILLYVGGMMILEAVRGTSEHLSLSGLKGIILGGIATSIDALSVGFSFGLSGLGWSAVFPYGISVLFFTALAVVAGMLCGSAVGARFGKPVRLAGGIILIAIGVHILL